MGVGGGKSLDLPGSHFGLREGRGKILMMYVEEHKW